jgi:hypothetical protein
LGYFNSVGNVSLLAPFVTTAQQHVHDATSTREVHAVAGAVMHTHLAYALTHWLTIAQVTSLCRTYALQYQRFAYLVFEQVKPLVKY